MWSIIDVTCHLFAAAFFYVLGGSREVPLNSRKGLVPLRSSKWPRYFKQTCHSTRPPKLIICQIESIKNVGSPKHLHPLPNAPNLTMSTPALSCMPLFPPSQVLGAIFHPSGPHRPHPGVSRAFGTAEVRGRSCSSISRGGSQCSRTHRVHVGCLILDLGVYWDCMYCW